MQKINETIRLLRKRQDVLPRPPLLIIHKPLVRPRSDCVKNLYAQTFSSYFQQKVESIQSCTSAGSSKGKLHQELGLEVILNRTWCREL